MITQPLIHTLAFIFAIFLLVSIHEYGHFWVARRFGVKTLRYSIGFGRPIVKWQGRDGTEYAIGWLPLGGYVRLLGEQDEEVPADQKHLTFSSKPVWSRFLIVLAGPITNWLLAIVLFWMVFIVGIDQSTPVIGKVIPNSIAANAGLTAGDRIVQVDQYRTPSWQRVIIAIIYRLGDTGTMKITTQSPSTNTNTVTLNLSSWQINELNPDPFKSLGFLPYQLPIPPVIQNVEAGQPAALAGLQPNDQIVTANGIKISDWMDLLPIIQQHPGQNLTLVIKRGKIDKTITVAVASKTITPWKKIGFIGAMAQMPKIPDNMHYLLKYSPIKAVSVATQEVIDFSKFNFDVLGKMVTGRISMRGLGGPITIYGGTKNAYDQGLSVYINFLAVLSVTLACINILPIPGLDGGHLLYFLVEAIRGKPLSLTTQNMGRWLGLLLLVAIMVQATVNDIMRIFLF